MRPAPVQPFLDGYGSSACSDSARIVRTLSDQTPYLVAYAPVSDYCIQVGVAGTLMWAIPILYTRAPKYDTARGGNFLEYVSFALMMVERSGTGGNARPLLQADAPKLLGLAEVSNFFEQVGRNTQYIIHPEEILADNFALLVLGEWSVPSPDVLRKISDALAEARG